MYYLFIEDGVINGCGQCPTLNEDILNIEVIEDVFNEYCETPNKYIWNGEEVILNPNFEAEEAQKEQERIAMLFLTAADVERGIYKARGMDFDDILQYLSVYPQEGLDIKAVKIELKANHFYRGNPYVNAIGSLLGFTSEQLDKFFEDGDYTHLLAKNEEKLPTEEIVLPVEPTNEDIPNE